MKYLQCINKWMVTQRITNLKPVGWSPLIIKCSVVGGRFMPTHFATHFEFPSCYFGWAIHHSQHNTEHTQKGSHVCVHLIISYAEMQESMVVTRCNIYYIMRYKHAWKDGKVVLYVGAAWRLFSSFCSKCWRQLRQVLKSSCWNYKMYYEIGIYITSLALFSSRSCMII